MKRSLFLFTIILFCGKVNAQILADSTVKHSPLKTLSYEQYNALITGDDIYGMSLAAELNHYPSPEKVIKLKREIILSPIQVTKISAIARELHRKKLEYGFDHHW